MDFLTRVSKYVCWVVACCSVVACVTDDGGSYRDTPLTSTPLADSRQRLWHMNGTGRGDDGDVIRDRRHFGRPKTIHEV